jgi:hypothetical protein
MTSTGEINKYSIILRMTNVSFLIYVHDMKEYIIYINYFRLYSLLKKHNFLERNYDIEYYNVNCYY